MVQGGSHVSLCELQKGATVPVVSLGSHKFTPLQGFALLVTLQEHFGYLKGLSLGWVGPMGGMLNTLLYLLPKVGVHLKYNTEPIPVTLYFFVYNFFLIKFVTISLVNSSDIQELLTLHFLDILDVFQLYLVFFFFFKSITPTAFFNSHKH